MTQSEFERYVQCLPGAPIVKIEAITDARLKKTGIVRHMHRNEKGELIPVETKVSNPFGKVKKRVIVNTQLGCKYENAVQRQGQREDNPDAKDFKAKARQWGDKEGKVVKYGGKVYLRTQTTAGMRRANRANIQYIAEDGRYLSDAQVAPYLPAKKEAKQAGNEDKIEERDYTLENIKSVTINGEKIIIE